ncbi:hypothetical protein AB4Y32_25335 [Paraburkholderia phymatum]|uniref:Uncharacterized protein n=1 Tax=Paraburkholderia phymatum TaxID=148447 RepID=A0ACC6U653_9BURK
MANLDSVQVSVSSNTDGHVIETHQVIPDSLLRDLEEKRLNSHTAREREFMEVASIPVCIVDKWLREGYDVFAEPIRKTVAKLKSENLEYFLSTAKEV